MSYNFSVPLWPSQYMSPRASLRTSKMLNVKGVGEARLSYGAATRPGVSVKAGRTQPRLVWHCVAAWRKDPPEALTVRRTPRARPDDTAMSS